MDRHFRATKPAAVSKSTSTRRSLKHAAAKPASPSPASHPATAPSLYADTLKQFDLNPRYGPSIGLSRLARWERAEALNLSPPEEIYGIITSDPGLAGRGFLESAATGF